MPTKKLIVITGPTASGKTDLSIRVAKHYRTEIISADSRQFYRQMNIGTAIPDPNQLSAVPHHFVAFLDPDQDYNIGKYESEALSLLDELFKTHDYLVMCGGSGLYIKAVTEGLDNLPPSDIEIRKKLTEELQQHGLEFLTEKLKAIDPDYYNSVDLKNPHRVIRAIEVFECSGSPFSSFRTGSKKDRPFSTYYFSIDLPRETLYQQINNRVDQMIESGLEAEVRHLLPYRHTNALQTVGYREFIDHFDGRLTKAKAIEAIKQNTRNYAKRQMTWIRKVEHVHHISPDDEKIIYSIIDKQ